MEGNPPPRWDGIECLKRMLTGCIAKARTLEREGAFTDIESAHVRAAILGALREVGYARWIEPKAQSAGVVIEGSLPLPTEPSRAREDF